MFEQTKNPKTYEVIIAQIRDMILNKELKKGDKLPSERSLAEQLNVSRTSVREALIALQTIGIIETKHGGGNFIRQSFEKSLLEPISIAFMLENRDPNELFEVRHALEVKAAGLAAENADKNDIAELKSLIMKIYTAEDSNIPLNAEFDKEFHYLVAKISRNFLIINLLNVITELMYSSITHVRDLIYSDGIDNKELVEIHRDICSKIIKHDIEASKAAMHKHFMFTKDYYQNL